MDKEARVGLALGGACIGLALLVDWAIRMLQEVEHQHTHSH